MVEVHAKCQPTDLQLREANIQPLKEYEMELLPSKSLI